jgi:hypothetical protein
MAERSRKSRPTAGLCARQSGADELRRRFGECAADERGGKFSASQSFENSENAERISPRGRLAPLHRSSGLAPARKWRRKGLKRLNSRPEMVWSRKPRTHKM